MHRRNCASLKQRALIKLGGVANKRYNNLRQHVNMCVKWRRVVANIGAYIADASRYRGGAPVKSQANTVVAKRHFSAYLCTSESSTAMNRKTNDADAAEAEADGGRKVKRIQTSYINKTSPRNSLYALLGREYSTNDVAKKLIYM